MPISTQSELARHAKASQDIIPIEEIRDGVVVMRDGSLRAVLMASSLNFALKAPDEQDAIIMQYQSFLNSLDFSVQISIQSRKLNIEPYLATLRERKKAETQELLRVQITEYITFIKDFVDTSNIVSKVFYVVVPFSPMAAALKNKQGMLDAIKNIFKKRDINKPLIDTENFAEYRTQLWQRIDTVTAGLIRSGVRAVPLNTEELIELYYGLYNPEGAEHGKAPQISGIIEKQ